MLPLSTTEFAPAKVNLTLHVTGQRADGFHLLDSLVVFAGIGDRVTVRPADRLSLTITGPQAALLPVTDDNLVLRAARLIGTTATITLHKSLPLASGIGGGSADAAATLRALTRACDLPMPPAQVILTLGADVPVCLSGQPARMSGVGESLAPLPPLPPAWLVLANPGTATPTPAVFRAMTRRDNPPMRGIPRLRNVGELAAFLALNRNDMEAAALTLAPAIAQVKTALTAQPGCLFARMSGSGATCYGLFADGLTAAAADCALQHAHPEWWVQSGAILG
ncbi:MAG: 4-(cytidine 5'-diphospho)-2-C-methyl-D-erythritol kinase [Pseudomonadota bacterium]